MDIRTHPRQKSPAHETLCRDCGQLRLSFVVSGSCGNCGSRDITIGPVGSLEKPL